MADEVKFIFKTLLKVPAIIFVCYFILNIFAFFFIYFKMLGASYVVMQVAVENNYLPKSELYELWDYVDTMNDIPMVNGTARIIVGQDNSNNYITMNSRSDVNGNSSNKSDARIRQQYGRTVTCGVQCKYTMVWPLDYKETTQGETGVDGLNGSNFTGFKDNATLAQDRKDKEYQANIRIVYTVPGLKYYPDMLTY